MTLEDYIRVLRKGWLIIAMTALLGVAVGAASGILATPMFKSVTNIFVSVQSTGASSAGELVQGNSYAQQKVQSYLAIVGSRSVLSPVIEELQLDTTPAELAQRISASSPVGTVIIEIAATDRDPRLAAEIANATASSLQNVVVELEQPSGGGPSLVKIQTVQPAEQSISPASPNLPFNIALGGMVGLVVGVAGAVLRSTLDTRVHGRQDVEGLTQVPILGATTFDAESNRHPLIVHTDPRNPRAESFRGLRTNLRFVNMNKDNRAFVVTSAIPGEGKSTTTANLALALAETGARVVLIDADLRLPALASYMGIEGAAGLTDVLIGQAALEDVLQHWGTKNLLVLPAGQLPPNPSELLGSDAMVELLAALNDRADYVLLDTPPLLPVTDAVVLSSITAGAIVVAAAGKVKKSELTAALRNLTQTSSRVIGIVLTMLPSQGPDSYGASEYSYYGGSTAGELMSKQRRRRGRK
ncbi:polysaccharide biosynthesis tyrosine autokinase [Herbiconiux flava]|uniref:non-specific protein-tyrosine kinase n=1 Tax=Herbiconiux flava TaxID=881268 RepID=A0A852SLF9_9MICO|nr:polysaccharide biosynthesis tyrosine autokinase [Herbiconiux flava]NYD68889.1 capsular exopolysaccharide synthesis family protein [Herbiconiux flava]GLK15632.1 chromosome partitioning protein [Herbiconiux flava]